MSREPFSAAAVLGDPFCFAITLTGKRGGWLVALIPDAFSASSSRYRYLCYFKRDSRLIFIL